MYCFAGKWTTSMYGSAEESVLSSAAIEDRGRAPVGSAVAWGRKNDAGAERKAVLPTVPPRARTAPCTNLNASAIVG